MRAVSSPQIATGLSKYEIEDTALIDRVARIHPRPLGLGRAQQHRVQRLVYQRDRPGRAGRGGAGHDGQPARPDGAPHAADAQVVAPAHQEQSQRRGLYNTVDNLNNAGDKFGLQHRPRRLERRRVLEYVSRDPSGMHAQARRHVVG
jgi:hypothetical protein